MSLQVEDRPLTDVQAPRIVEAQPPVRAPSPVPVAARRMGTKGRWALGLGIPFVMVGLSIALQNYPNGALPNSIIVYVLIQMAEAVGIAAGAFLLRSWWALLAVPVAVFAGALAGGALAMVIYTASQSGLAAGFDPSRWPPSGDPSWPWSLAFMTVAQYGLLAAGLGLVMSKVRVQERQRQPAD